MTGSLMKNGVRAVLADDLTGACDTGVKFLQPGLPTYVSLYGQTLAASEEGTQVICTLSRALSPTEAANRVRQALRSLRAIQAQLIYKKIDSTLHGNLGAEIIATLEDLNRSLALVAPAHPRMGRRIIAGQLILGGQRSPSGRRLPQLLEDQTDRPIHCLALADVRLGSSNLIVQLEKIVQHGGRVVAADTETEDDLTILADAVANFPKTVLPVGSAGLAGALAKIWHGNLENVSSQGDELFTDQPSVDHNSVVLLTGSKNEATDSQIKTLLANTPALDVRLVDTTQEDYDAAISDGRHLVVRVDWVDAERDRLDMLVNWIARRRPPGIILSGGDTAEMFFHTAAVSMIRLVGELSPGVVSGRLCGGPLEGLPVVTKAGGFGEENALVNATRHLSAALIRSESRDWQ